MIPKTIHYCWFGRGEKPKLVKKCIESWKKHLPDYALVEWNENNFDVSQNDFVRQAYAHRNFAFVSDYARAKALYEHGGIYFDTDVEVLQSFDAFLHHMFFVGFEEKNFVGTCVMGAQKGCALLRAPSQGSGFFHIPCLSRNCRMAVLWSMPRPSAISLRDLRTVSARRKTSISGSKSAALMSTASARPFRVAGGIHTPV